MTKSNPEPQTTSRTVRNDEWRIPNRGSRCRRCLAAATITLLLGASARAVELRIVSYNIDDADQGNDNNITATYAGLPTVLQAIGKHHIGANAQPIDVLGVEELNSTTLSNLVTALNNTYGAGTYAYDHTADPTTGGGTDGLIYNTETVQVVSSAAVGTASTSGAPALQCGTTYDLLATVHLRIFTCT